jgi:hypothetical protein
LQIAVLLAGTHMCCVVCCHNETADPDCCTLAMIFPNMLHKWLQGTSGALHAHGPAADSRKHMQAAATVYTAATKAQVTAYACLTAAS